MLKWWMSWNQLDPPGTRLTQHWTDMKNRFIGRNCVWNTIAQKNTTLAIAIVTKSSISDIFRWNHLEWNGTSTSWHKKDTHRAILCVQYHANITVQITIVTKISILNVGKVSQIWLCFIYILNKKNTITFNENKACTKLLR